MGFFSKVLEKGRSLSSATTKQSSNTATVPPGLLPADADPSHWANLTILGEGVSKQLGVTPVAFWDALLDSRGAMGALNHRSKRERQHKAEYTYDFEEEDTEYMHEKLKRWILEHPAEAVALLVYSAAAQGAVLLVPTLLGLLDFTPTGAAAGSIAAWVQSVVGPAVARGAFPTLTSAAMGDYGVAIVKAIATTATGTCSVASKP